MAYAFNDDKSKADVYTKAETDQRVIVLENELDEILREQDLDPNKDQELVGIRTGYNGAVYPTAGDAVRKQIKDIKQWFSSPYHITGSDFPNYGYIGSSGEVVDPSDTNWLNTDYVKVDPGTVVNCHLIGVANTVYTVAAYNDLCEFIEASSVNQSIEFGTYTVPSGVTYLRFCIMSIHAANCYVTIETGAYLSGVEPCFNILNNEINAIKSDVSDIEDNLSFYEMKLIPGNSFPNNGWINSSGETQSPSDTNWLNTDYYKVNEGDSFDYKLDGLNGTVYTIAAYDSSKSFVVESSITQSGSGTYTVPNGISFVRFCCGSAYAQNDYVDGIAAPEIGVQNAVDYVMEACDTHTRLIMIGDSYGIQNSDGDITKFYWEYVKDALNLTENVDFFKKYYSGAGFGNNEFLTNLQSLSSSIEDKKAITDIFVCGGWNDSDPNQSYGTDAAFNAGILAFDNYVKTNYPNATIHLAHISWGNFSSYSQLKLSLDRYIKAANLYGWRFISNAEYILRNVPSNSWQTDQVHPNNNGQEILGKNLVAPFLSGSADMNAFSGDVLVIGSKKISFNQDGSITWTAI